MEQSGGSVAQQEEWIPDAAKIKWACLVCQFTVFCCLSSRVKSSHFEPENIAKPEHVN